MRITGEWYFAINAGSLEFISNFLPEALFVPSLMGYFRSARPSEDLPKITSLFDSNLLISFYCLNERLEALKFMSSFDSNMAVLLADGTCCNYPSYCTKKEPLCWFIAFATKKLGEIDFGVTTLTFLRVAEFSRETFDEGWWMIEDANIFNSALFLWSPWGGLL